VVDTEPHLTSFGPLYGELAAADRRPDRIVWPDRQWQWAALRFENGDFYAADHLDVDAREKWFFQAIGASPAMFTKAVPQGRLVEVQSSHDIDQEQPELVIKEINRILRMA
jgi:hypothetical protein